MFERLVADLDAVVERDPACADRLDALMSSPGVWALGVHRCAHRLWVAGAHRRARMLATVVRLVCGIDIHPGAAIGDGVLIDHGVGVVIGETAWVGCGVTIYQGVSLGATSSGAGWRHPRVEDDVLLGAGAKVLGPVVVGAGARVGANAVVLADVAAGSVVVGVPGQAQSPASNSPVSVELDFVI